MKIAGKSHDRRTTGHPGYRATCAVCGVSAMISEKVLLKRLEKGLAEQNLQITAIPGKPEGTPWGLLGPLLITLRQKGFKIL